MSAEVRRDVQPLRDAELTTARLTLREPRDGDEALLLAYFLRNEPRFAPWDPTLRTELAEYAHWIAWRREESAAGKGRGFLAFDRDAPDTLVAIVNLYDVKGPPTYTAMIGYGVDGAYEGRGYVREAVEAVLTHAFDAFELKRIIATYDPANSRSGALLRRLGFAIEGYARDALYLRGHWRDSILTALPSPAWKPPGSHRAGKTT